MTKRRSVLSIISGIFTGVVPVSKLLACSDTGEYFDILIRMPTKNLANFLPGDINKYLNYYYESRWDWSSDIGFKFNSLSSEKESAGIRISESWSTVQVTLDADHNYLNDKEYCSNITLVYSKINGKYHSEIAPFNPVTYEVLSHNHSEEVLPYLSTRIKMSSKSAEIYGVFTIRDLITNEINRINVTKIPLTLSVHSCGILEFKYVNT